LESAHELGKLCQNQSLVVNLIPYNQTSVRDKLRCPSKDHIREFQAIVTSYNVFCTTRRTMGADIDSACGQLVVLNKHDKAGQQDPLSRTAVVIGDIEDGLVGGDKRSSTASASKNKKSVIKDPSQSSARATTSNGPNRQQQSVSDGKGDDPLMDLEKWILPLRIATTVAASCFLMSTVLYLKQKKR
jgi:hypothetical protein